MICRGSVGRTWRVGERWEARNDDDVLLIYKFLKSKIVLMSYSFL